MPPKRTLQDSVVVKIRIPSWMYDKIKTLADKETLELAVIIRKLIRKGLEAEGVKI